LLLHAAFGTWRLWEPLLPGLERSFDVLAPTLLGHFEGEPLPQGVAAGIGPLADHLERELDAAGWDTAHVAGASLGGLLALELAQRGRARSVLALAPGGDFQRAGTFAAKRIDAIFTINRALGRRLLPRAERFCGSARGRRLLFRQVSAHPERLDPAAAAYAFRASVECPIYRELLHASTHDRPLEFDHVGCPVLLAWPTNDRMLPFKRYGRPLHAALPSADVRMLDDVGHLAMIDEPATVATLIRDFAGPTGDDRAPAPRTETAN
jgi:pimeloyl-ACP methyl ester carboxylesterase